jgi:hypothetical protein
MTVRNQNFSLHVGEAKTVFVALTNEDGTAFDLAGSTMEWWLAKTSHSDKIMQKKLGEGLSCRQAGSASCWHRRTLTICLPNCIIMSLRSTSARPVCR